MLTIVFAIAAPHLASDWRIHNCANRELELHEQPTLESKIVGRFSNIKPLQLIELSPEPARLSTLILPGGDDVAHATPRKRVLEITDYWLKVRADGRVGWVHGGGLCRPTFLLGNERVYESVQVFGWSAAGVLVHGFDGKVDCGYCNEEALVVSAIDLGTGSTLWTEKAGGCTGHAYSYWHRSHAKLIEKLSTFGVTDTTWTNPLQKLPLGSGEAPVMLELGPATGCKRRCEYELFAISGSTRWTVGRTSLPFGRDTNGHPLSAKLAAILKNPKGPHFAAFIHQPHDIGPGDYAVVGFTLDAASSEPAP